MEETRHSGFTLIELLVTLALVALLAAQAVPAMGRFIDKARLRSAGETLSRQLQFARNHALTYQLPVYFSVSVSKPEHWCYGWSEAADCDCTTTRTGTSSCTTVNGNQGLVHHQLSTAFPAVSLTHRSTTSRNIRFSPVRGTASADSLILRNKAGSLRVVVSPLGRIRICAIDYPGYPPC